MVSNLLMVNIIMKTLIKLIKKEKGVSEYAIYCDEHLTVEIYP